jgi:hypothetical protein
MGNYIKYDEGICVSMPKFDAELNLKIHLMHVCALESYKYGSEQELPDK